MSKSACTQAIEVFEEEIENIRKKYLDLSVKAGKLGITEVEARDSELERYQWAIDLLDKAYRDGKMQ